jgi:hypothetical protein
MSRYLSKWSVGVIIANVFFLNFFLSAWYTIHVARVLLDATKTESSSTASESPVSRLDYATLLSGLFLLCGSIQKPPSEGIA